MEIPSSAAEMVLTLELNLERDKTGDVGQFHDTYIIHISKFMITRNHTLLISNPFSLQRPFGRHLWFDIFLFNCILYSANRDSTLLMTVMLTVFTFWSWIKRLFTVCSKKVQALVNILSTGFVFNRVETKGGSVLCFSQDKLTCIFRSRRKCKHTTVSWIINVSASLVSFFCKFKFTVQNHSVNWGGDFREVVETPCSGEYFFCFTTLEAVKVTPDLLPRLFEP